MKTRLILAALTLGCFVGTPPLAAAVPVESRVLTLKVSGTAHGPNVLMKDVIAEDLPEPLANLALKVAGRPGGEVNVVRPLVQMKLKAHGKGAWTLGGAQSCQLSVPIQKITGLQIQSFAADYLSARISATAGADLETKAAPADLNTYDAATRFIIAPGGQDWRGNVVLRVRVMQAGVNGEEQEVASVPVSFVVHRKEPRVYSRKPLRKGDVLDPDVLILREEDTTFAQGQGFAGFDELSGKRARAYIGAGKAITVGLVELPALIRRGDMVRLLVKSGGVVIETQGKAMRDAHKGESLPIELENTKKQVQARCVDSGVAVREAY